ncbi:MAG: cobalamin biosynthesis protein [Chloroflexi bacterium]|nr:cobalamin biosynthesis protein [Chloroflexota bacterium]
MIAEILILLLAVLIDQLLGEPPSIVHPVVWIGKVIEALMKASPRHELARLAYGALIVTMVVAAFGLGTFFLLDLLKGWNVVAYVVVGAFLFKTTFAVRELRQAAIRVFSSLVGGNLEVARAQLRHLVSRNTARLDEPLIVAATVESVAENVTDSFLAPLLFFSVLGVPGAMAYRVVNTFDAMIGYRGEYEYLGKFAARLDDVLNFVPARLGGVLTVVATALARADTPGAWRVMLRDHSLTESPNAGWTMSAMSGALGVQLEKVGHYRLGDPVAELTPLKILRTVDIMYVVVILALSLALLLEVLIDVHFP